MTAQTDKTKANLHVAQQVLVALLAGLVAGSIAAALERDPSLNYRTLLYGSFASGSIGLWTFLSVVGTVTARNPREAGVRVGCFLGAVVTTYYGIRYFNFMSIPSNILAASALDGATHATFYAAAVSWPAARWISLVAGLVSSAVAGIVCYNIVRSVDRPGAFWLWASVPVFLLVFEGWTFFIPMLIYQNTSLLPALVDILGAFLSAALLVRMRSRATVKKATLA